MSEVLQDAIEVILVGHTIVVDIEHARLTFIALDTNEFLPATTLSRLPSP